MPFSFGGLAVGAARARSGMLRAERQADQELLQRTAAQRAAQRQAELDRAAREDRAEAQRLAREKQEADALETRARANDRELERRDRGERERLERESRERIARENRAATAATAAANRETRVTLAQLAAQARRDAAAARGAGANGKIDPVARLDVTAATGALRSAETGFRGVLGRKPRPGQFKDPVTTLPDTTAYREALEGWRGDSTLAAGERDDARTWQREALERAGVRPDSSAAPGDAPATRTVPAAPARDPYAEAADAYRAALRQGMPPAEARARYEALVTKIATATGALR